jgi:putative colanic acid biosynthesis acetyltransferase WcaF
MGKLDASARPSPHGVGNRVARAAWGVVWAVLFRPTPKVCHGWRRLLLRAFGAKLGRGAVVHPTVRVWAPWNLEMGEYACLAPRVDCYSVARVRVGAHATVSQYSYLCTATHDIEDPGMRLVTAPIEIGDGAWVCADVFVGPGVTIGEGTVVGARSSVFEDLPSWTVCVGTPARAVRERVAREEGGAG